MKILLSLILLIPAAAAAADPCLDCHLEKTPAAVRVWQESLHSRKGVGCAACHGSDHAAIERGEARVNSRVCGRCHPRALAEHAASRHGMGLHSGWGCTRNLPSREKGECRFCHEKGSEAPTSGVHCARFLKQSSEMADIGCNRCHDVESSCASCHTNHATDLKIVRDPGVCAKCHMGPDHPQWEMWETSQHGTLWGSAGKSFAPDCLTCHMPGGSHDVSVGITMSSAGIPYAPEKAAPRREEMVKICSACHAPAFARKELSRGDAVRAQSLALTKEAEGIVRDLYDRGLLDPMPERRPPHPLSGAALVLDAQMLYEDTSHIERLLFKMKKYDLAKTLKGAYHQNPAYAHWYGNAELKMDLVDIRSEASRLRERKGKAAAAPAPGKDARIDEELGVLKKRMERGEISAADYAAAKEKLLAEFLGKK